MSEQSTLDAAKEHLDQVSLDPDDYEDEYRDGKLWNSGFRLGMEKEFAAFAAKRNADLIAEREILANALQQVDDWAHKAYPDDVWIEPTKEEWRQVDEVLKAAGFSLTSISGANMRHVLTEVGKITSEALSALSTTTEQTK